MRRRGFDFIGIHARNPMKRKFLILTSVLLSFLFGIAAIAAEIAPEGTRPRQLQRGFVNLTLAPMEVSHALAEENEAGDKIGLNWVFGLLRGGLATAGRSLFGVYEILASVNPLTTRRGGAEEPEFPWQLLDASDTAT